MKIIAPHYINKKVTEVTSVIEVDRFLLRLEYEQAVKRGKASGIDPVEIMQRKANLGMNAILSMSLALARLIAHFQGKELWQVLREEMKRLIAGLIDKHGDLDVIGQVVTGERLQLIRSAKEKNRALDTVMSYDELVAVLRLIEPALKGKGMKLYETLRKQLSLYSIT